MRLKNKSWEEIYEIGKGRAEDQNLKMKGWGIEKAMFTKVTILHWLFFSQNLTMGVFELDFLMVKMDSAPSKPQKASKILKFDSSNSDFQNFLLNFVIIIFKILLFS